ncbi:basic secretory protein-like protein [Undibacterium sp. Ji42W]|uniref:basic secretory protein-like protein n=1 Tax=Undibacterium sp. Ji42W TaxID=3413039 RepID=UPI003BF0A0C7
MRTFLILTVMATGINLLINLPAIASEPGKLPAQMQLTRIAADKWRADYSFSEAISRFSMPAAGDYRSTAWKPLTTGVHYQAEPSAQPDQPIDSYILAQPARQLSFEITSYNGFAQKNYSPNNRYSNGGAGIYMGFFDGDVQEGGKTRGMNLTVSYQGLPGETVIPPPSFSDAERSLRAYAYFGPQKPVLAGAAKLVLDPATPEWLARLILDTTSTMSAYFSSNYQRPLLRELVLMISVTDTSSPGFSMKGGATNGQITFRLSGKAMLNEHPAIRHLVQKLVAHEMAHIWQENVSQGGIGDEPAWIHEGGAEAMAIEALKNTGIWTAEEAVTYQTNASATCKKITSQSDPYHYAYACGLQKFMALNVDIPLLWRSLISETGQSGQPYSEAMLVSVSQRLRNNPSVSK